MRTILTVPSLAPEFGGPAAKARRLSEELQRLGCPTDLVGVGEGHGATGLSALGAFHGTPIPRQLGRLSSMIAAADVVHILGYRDPLGTVAAWMARRRRMPYLVEPVGMHRRRLRSVRFKGAFDRLVGHRLIRGAACVVATSGLEAEELAADGIPTHQIRVRPNGVDLEELLPLPPRGALRNRLNIPAEAPLVLALGRIAAKKGLTHLAEALARVPATWGLVAGPDDHDGTLEALVGIRERLGLIDRLVVLSRGLWREDRAQAFADADAFCLPSATENFGNAAAEAAACGVPVVLSDQCGATEWLHPCATRIVPYGDVGALTAALGEALHEGAVRCAAREAASSVRAALSWPEIAGRQYGIYLELLTRDRQAHAIASSKYSEPGRPGSFESWRG